jgi:NIMA (never in mitosis gene a)-related kinase
MSTATVGLYFKAHAIRKYLPEYTIWNFMTQLISALHECHFGSEARPHPAILHRDIKPENVFLDSLQNLKLGDFGLSKVMPKESDFAKTMVGTPFYMSPELVCDQKYNTKSDIWALGCLLYELCALEPPFQAETHKQLNCRIQIGNPPKIPSIYSYALDSIIRSMLDTDPIKRPSTADLLQLERIKLLSKEIELNQLKIELKKKEDDLLKVKEALDLKEKELDQRERMLQLRERQSKQTPTRDS